MYFNWYMMKLHVHVHLITAKIAQSLRLISQNKMAASLSRELTISMKSTDLGQMCATSIHVQCRHPLNFWGKDRQCAFFDMRVFNSFVQNYRNTSLSQCYRQNELEKKRTYKERLRETVLFQEYCIFTNTCCGYHLICHRNWCGIYSRAAFISFIM